MLTLVVALFVGVGYLVVHYSAASSCTVSSILVNSCRPWLGAAVGGDPLAASDKISQFNFLEKEIGHPLDIFHDYHPAGNLPLNSDEAYFGKRAGTYDYINWKPAGKWVEADGGNATVNAQIKQAADNIKSFGHKVFLTVHHEPENDVSAFDNSTQQAACKASPTFTGLKGSSGTPNQYRAMWQNVRNIFNKEGVTNVVWVMNYMGYKNWDCLAPFMWPGNSLVDWVTMDSYADGAQTWSGTVGRIYGVLQSLQGKTYNGEQIDITSKPWGSAEFNDCNSTSNSQIDGYFTSIKTAIDTNQYPRIKMYMVYDDTGNNAGPGCLVDHLPSGAYDASKLASFNKVADDPVFTSTPKPSGTPSPTSTPTPSPSHTPSPTPSPSHSPSPTPNPSHSPSPSPVPGQTGLTGTYYPNMDFTGQATTKTVKDINFDWCIKFPFFHFHFCWSPASGLGTTNYSIRWAGQVTAPTTGAYTFTTTTDDGTRLYVNGQLLINQWHLQPATSWSGTINLAAGQPVPLVMDYYQHLGVASAKLTWKGPGMSKPEVVPSADLTPGPVPPIPFPPAVEHWLMTSNHLAALESQDPKSAGWFFNTPNAFSLGGSVAGLAAAPIKGYKSYAQFASDLSNHAIPAGIRWVQYDNESWNLTPLSEAQNPASYMQAFANLAHQHGLKVIETPARDLMSVSGANCKTNPGESVDHAFIRCGIPQAARYADVYEIQAQADQPSVSAYASLVNAAINQVRSKNPGITITAGLTTDRGDSAAQIYACWKAVHDMVTGFWLNTTTPTFPVAAQVLDTIRNANQH